MNNEFAIYVVLSIVGFVLGGIIGLIHMESWFPYSWYGMLAVWGIVFVGCNCD